MANRIALPEANNSRLEPLIWSSVLRSLQLPLIEQGVDFDTLIAECGILKEEVERPQGQIPLKRYFEVLRRAAAMSNDPLIGVRLARAAGPETLGALGFLFMSSHNLAEALRNLAHYVNLLQDNTSSQFNQTAKDLSFAYQVYEASDHDVRQDVEFSLVLTCRLIRMYGGPSVRVRHVSFRHSASAPRSDYERLIKAPCRFDQDLNAISITAASGQVRNQVLDHGLSKVIKDYLDDQFRRRNERLSFTDQVSEAVFDGALAPPHTSEKIAQYLGISKMTLYRRLKQEGTSFKEITDARLFEVSKSYLCESKLTVTQIALTLGYAETASFTRAFARWSGGITPAKYRRKHSRLVNLHAVS